MVATFGMSGSCSPLEDGNVCSFPENDFGCMGTCSQNYFYTSRCVNVGVAGPPDDVGPQVATGVFECPPDQLSTWFSGAEIIERKRVKCYYLRRMGAGVQPYMAWARPAAEEPYVVVSDSFDANGLCEAKHASSCRWT